MAIVTLSNVRKRFGSTVALDGIDLTITRPHIFGVVGPDGAGQKYRDSDTVIRQFVAQGLG